MILLNEDKILLKKFQKTHSNGDIETDLTGLTNALVDIYGWGGGMLKMDLIFELLDVDNKECEFIIYE